MSGIRGSKKSIWDTRFGKQKKSLAFDECLKISGWASDDWITMKGSHVLVGEAGEILGGLGGKFKNLKDVPRKKQGAEKNGKINLTTSSFPKAFTSTPAEAANTEKLINFINSREGVNPEILELLNNSADIINGAKGGENLEIRHKFDGGVFYFSDSKPYIECPALDAEDITGQAGTTIHEMAHALDWNINEDNHFSLSGNNKELKNIFETSDGSMGEEIKAVFREANKRYDAAIAKVMAEGRFEERKQELDRRHYGDPREKDHLWSREWGTQRAALALEEREKTETAGRAAMQGVNSLQDIYGGLLYEHRGEGYDLIKYNHNDDYYKNVRERCSEAFADFVTMSIVSPEYVEVLRRDNPELVTALERQVREMNEKVKARKAG